MNVITASSYATNGIQPYDRLQRDGFCVIPNLVLPTDIQKLRNDLLDRFAATPFCKGGFYGSRTKRFGSILKHSWRHLKVCTPDNDFPDTTRTGLLRCRAEILI